MKTEFTKRRAVLIALSMAFSFVALRVFLSFRPDTDLNIGRYNIHHLFTGLLMITFFGLPLVLWAGRSPWLDLCALGFGSGLAHSLDEWVYLIATDGTNKSYLLPVSFWGGAIMIAGTLLYLLALASVRCKCKPGDQTG